MGFDWCHYSNICFPFNNLQNYIIIFLRLTTMRGFVIFLVLVAYLPATLARPRISERGVYRDMMMGDCVSSDTDLMMLCYNVSTRNISMCKFCCLFNQSLIKKVHVCVYVKITNMNKWYTIINQQKLNFPKLKLF